MPIVYDAKLRFETVFARPNKGTVKVHQSYSAGSSTIHTGIFPEFIGCLTGNQYKEGKEYWHEVLINGKKGWLQNEKGSRPVPALKGKAAYAKGAGVRVRSTTDISNTNNIIATFNGGLIGTFIRTALIQAAAGYIWYEVKLEDGRTGFIRHDVVSFVPTQSTAPVQKLQQLLEPYQQQYVEQTKQQTAQEAGMPGLLLFGALGVAYWMGGKIRSGLKKKKS
jgi:hypothetical protein